MLTVKFTGFDKLQRDFQDALSGLNALNVDLTTLIFQKGDASETHALIDQVNSVIDDRAGRYVNNPIVGSIAAKMKEHFQEVILDRASQIRTKPLLQIPGDSEMNSALEAKKRKRYEFMQKLYSESDGNPLVYFSAVELSTELGWTEEDTNLTAEYVANEGLAKWVAMPSIIAITHRGVVEVERATEQPEAPTEHFPAIHNHINIKTMTNSIIQQNSAESNATLPTATTELGDIAAFVKALRASFEEGAFSKDEDQEFKADIDTVQAQLTSPKPKVKIMRDALMSLRDAALKLIVTATTSELADSLPAVEAFIRAHLV